MAPSCVLRSVSWATALSRFAMSRSASATPRSTRRRQRPIFAQYSSRRGAVSVLLRLRSRRRGTEDESSSRQHSPLSAVLFCTELRVLDGAWACAESSATSSTRSNQFRGGQRVPQTRSPESLRPLRIARSPRRSRRGLARYFSSRNRRASISRDRRVRTDPSCLNSAPRSRFGDPPSGTLY